MIGNYEQVVEKIAKASAKTIEEIERMIEAKRAKLSGLISKEGAAQIVASELGINFEKEKMKISELLSGMKKVNLVGKIIEMFPVRTYEKNGRSGKIGSFVLADDTGNIRIVLWDTKHIELIEKGNIKKDDVVEMSNASVRNAEIHLTGFSDIKLSNEVFSEVKTEKSYNKKNILDLRAGENVKLRAFIVQIFEPRFFTVCPSCGKKVSDAGECQEHGKVSGEKRAVLNLVLDDGTKTIRAVFFSEQITKLIDEEDLEGEGFEKKRRSLLGNEMFFSGLVKTNNFFGNLEINVQDSKEAGIDELIKELENK